jgi:hypothetical protein
MCRFDFKTASSADFSNGNARLIQDGTGAANKSSNRTTAGEVVMERLSLRTRFGERAIKSLRAKIIFKALTVSAPRGLRSREIFSQRRSKMVFACRSVILQICH